MKSNSIIFALLGVLLLTTGCDNSAPSSLPNKNQKRDLHGLSDQELLKAKYNSATVWCAIWMERSMNKIDTSSEPQAIFTQDLMLNGQGGEYPLSVTVDAAKIDAKLQLSDLTIYRGWMTLRQNGKTLRSYNSPVLKVALTYNGEDRSLANVPHFFIGSIPATTLSENSESTLLSNRHGVRIGDSQEYTNMLSTQITCALKTEIKPEYSDEFIVE